MADIFISYARADKVRVAPLVAALEAQGWSVWWDPAIVPGQEFDERIAEEIDNANAVVVVWTPTSVASRWVRGEAREAADRGVLVPVRLENARLPIDARSLHTVDLDDWNEDPGNVSFQELLHALAGLLGHESSSKARGTPDVASPMNSPAKRQQIRYCKAKDGTRIAYASVGSGPPIVKTANWLTHLEYDWEHSISRNWYDALMQRHRLIRFDERGCGLSDWEPKDISLGSFVNDLEAVVDAAGAERFCLFAISQGTAVAMRYAALHPDRVACLILLGGFASGQLHREDGNALKQLQALRSLIEVGWAGENPAYRQTFTSLMFPDAKPEDVKWFNEIQKRSASAENALRIVDAVAAFDVRPELPLIQCPTLVLHAADDAMAPFALGREIAQAIDGARLVALDTASHLPAANDPAWPRCLAELNDFLDEYWPGEQSTM